jgi:hypothetical protein
MTSLIRSWKLAGNNNMDQKEHRDQKDKYIPTAQKHATIVYMDIR